MARVKLALRVESLGLGAKSGIVAAGELGVEGVELDATQGDTAPENLSRTGRREVMRFITSRRLQIAALNGDFGSGFSDPRRADELVERMQRVIELAVDLGVFVVVAPAIPVPPKEGKAPPQPTEQRLHLDVEAEASSAKIYAEVLKDLANMAANYDRILAVRTGLSDGASMAAFLTTAGECARAAFDPAALLTGGFDPLKAVWDLGKHIAYVYARDAVGPQTGRARLVALGEGHVKFREFLAALDGVGYDGFVAVESLPGHDPLQSAGAAVRFLRQF